MSTPDSEPIKFTKMFNALWNSFIPPTMDRIRSAFNEPQRPFPEQFTMALNNLKLFKTIAEREIPGSVRADKSVEKSREMRAAGNAAYCRDRDNGKALLLYSESVALAPYNAAIWGNTASCDELSLAFANRSAVLLTVRKYDACLADIRHALDAGYPKSLRGKLYKRRDECERRLSGLQPATDGALPPLTSGRDPRIPGAAKSVTPQRGGRRGRYLQANQDIHAGDVIVVERPYCSALLPEFFRTNCSGCLVRCDCMVGCKKCSLALYCSESCRDKSWAEYHMLECCVLPSLLALRMPGSWALALRAVMRAISTNSVGALNTLVTRLDRPDPTLLTAPTLKLNWQNDFVPMHGMERNAASRSTRDAYKMATMAACIVSGLTAQNSTVFTTGGFGAVPKHKVGTFVGALLIRFLQIVECNEVPVVDLLLPTDPDQNKFKVVCVGWGLYAVCGLLNHACDANAVLATHGGHALSVRASRRISRGEEICRDYGYTFSRHSRDERRIALQHKYYFQCACVACTQDWPGYAVLKASPPTALCPTCGSALVGYSMECVTSTYPCVTCHRQVDVTALRRTLETTFNRFVTLKAGLQAGCREDVTQEVAGLIDLVGRVLERPCQVTVDLQDLLRHAAMQTGNFYRV